MKRMLLICAVLVCATSAFAQRQQGFGFGARAGVNIADYTGSTGGSRAGLYVGVFTDYYISRKFGLELGGYYSQQGSHDNIESGSVLGRADYNFDYVSAQLFAKFHFVAGFRVFAGAEPSFLVNATRKFTSNDGLRQVSDVKDAKYFDVAITGGVGYTFRFGLDLQAGYSRGLFPMFANAANYNSIYRVTIGWRFLGSGGRTAKGTRKSQVNKIVNYD